MWAGSAFALTVPPDSMETEETLQLPAADQAAVETPVILIVRHSAWESMPPKGTEAHGIRRNLGPGDEVGFEDLSVRVIKTHPAKHDEEGNPVISPNDKVTLLLRTDADSKEFDAEEGSAFNWGEYHLQIPAIHAGRGELGGGVTAIEIATIDSLPPGFADSTTAGGAERRLRVRHEIDKLTLHHSATSHVEGDDLGLKMRNMQSWGESDRKWWDIPYHYMVDLDGTVFQARDHRFVGDTNTRYNPAGHFLINCFGNYSEVEPNEAQLTTIANLMAWAAMEYHIDPLVIYGHRDLAQTSCPGDNLYRYIENGELQKRVEAVMAKGKPTIEWVE
jgi:hypothetical protein